MKTLRNLTLVLGILAVAAFMVVQFTATKRDSASSDISDSVATILPETPAKPADAEESTKSTTESLDKEDVASSVEGPSPKGAPAGIPDSVKAAPEKRDAIKALEKAIAVKAQQGNQAAPQPEQVVVKRPVAVDGITFDFSTPEARAKTVAALKAKEDAEYAEAVAAARKNGWEISGTREGGGAFHLKKLIDGRPIYVESNNADAALSIGVDQIRFPVVDSVLNGTGWKVGVWEVGRAIVDHREYIIKNTTTSRVTYRDGSSTTLSDHANHVIGTIAASGVDALSIGMAPGATIDAYDVLASESEMCAAGAASVSDALNGFLLVSNHSYGFPVGWSGQTWSPIWPVGVGASALDAFFGSYDQNAAITDAVCFAAPYYLPIWAAGNERNDNPNAANAANSPLGDGIYKNGYDTIGADSGSKNMLSVGNYTDAVVNIGSNIKFRSPTFALPTPSTSYGPMDDGRIKPDLVANGDDVKSTSAQGVDKYYNTGGTSMAAPGVAGAAILLQQRYNLFTDRVMRSATLKALMINTADDIGTRKPDYASGFGLLNAKAASDLINRNYESPANRHIYESQLNGPSGDSQEFFVEWDGESPIKATLCWTDPPGSQKSNTALDDRTPSLVHDLDIKLTAPDWQAVLPFVLDPNNPAAEATRADNTVDNVEQVYINPPNSNVPSGLYKVSISHKGNLTVPQLSTATSCLKKREGRLLNALNSTNTTITLVNAADFPTSGRIDIWGGNGREVAFYSGVSGNQLTNVIRGRSSAGAFQHAANTPVVLQNPTLLATDSFIILDDASAFPVDPLNQAIQINIGDDNSGNMEIASYSGKSGNRLTGVTRGIGGTTAATHSAGTTVELRNPQPQLVQPFSLVMSGTKSAGTLADAVENYDLQFVQPASSVGWGHQTTDSHDGDDATQSPIASSGTPSVLETTVTGPGRIAFWVKMKQPNPYLAQIGFSSTDTFSLEIDGSSVYSGNTQQLSEWTQIIQGVPAGTHTLRWKFSLGTGLIPVSDRYVFLDQIDYLRFQKPYNLVAEEGPFETSLNWDYDQPSSGYAVYTNTSPNIVGATRRYVGSDGTTSAISPDRSPNYFAVAMLSKGSNVESPLSDWVEPKLYVGMPRNLSASDGAFDDRIEVTWTEAAGSVEEYHILRTSQGGLSEDIFVSGTSYTDTAAAPGEVVTYQVGAKHPGGFIGRYTNPDTGFRFDAAGFQVTAATQPGSVRISFPQISWSDWDYRILRTNTNVSPDNGNNAYTLIPYVTDDSAVPGVTYYYWVQRRNLRLNPGSAWETLGSAAGSAGLPSEFDYVISTSDDLNGPTFRWIDVARRWIKTPGFVSTESTQFYPVNRLIDDSGLSETTTLDNVGSVTHASVNPSNAWVTNDSGLDYFAAGVPPVINFSLVEAGKTLGVEKVTDLVIWGYQFGSANGNEAKRFKLDFYDVAPINSTLFRDVWQLNNNTSGSDVGEQYQLHVLRNLSSLIPRNFSAVYSNSTIDGETARVLNLPALSPSQRLEMPNDAGANGGGGATFTNQWTIAMDVNFDGGLSPFQSLIQTLEQNTNDVDVYINPNGSVEFGGTLSDPGAVQANTWHRLVFTCGNNGSGGDLQLKAYVDGKQTSIGGVPQSSTQSLDGRYALGNLLNLFSDDTNNTQDMLVNSVGFWGRELTSEEAVELGRAKASGIPGVFADFFEPTGETITVESPSIQTGNSHRLPFDKPYLADGVKMTILDNWFEDAIGGDRVGLGEVKFVAKVAGFGGGMGLFTDGSGEKGYTKRHGYVSESFDTGGDSSNDSSLPKNPSSGGSGKRIYPYHDSLNITGADLTELFAVAGSHPHSTEGNVDVWQWDDVKLQSGSDPFSFQVLKFGDSGDFIFQYKAGNPGGGGATIGLQDFAAGKAATYAINDSTAIPTDRNFAILFKLQSTTPQPAPSVPFLVTTSIDEDNGALGLGAGNSLRELMLYGPATSVGNFSQLRIAFPGSMSGQTINLTAGQILIDRDNKQIVIDGSNAPGLRIDGGGNHRLFDLLKGQLEFKNLTLTNGRVNNQDGGAIRIISSTQASASSSVKFTGVTVTNCHADGSGRGGVIGSASSRSIEIRNSTLSGNSAGAAGGAIFTNVALGANGSLKIINTTITANQVTSGDGGGIFNGTESSSSTSSVLSGSIVSGNTASGSGDDFKGYTFSRTNPFVSLNPTPTGGYNIIGDPAGAEGLTPEDIIGVDPRLGPLQDNGGNTWTHALLSGSPALDAATGTNGGYYLPTDQRGVPRSADGDLDALTGGPDIGSFELERKLIVTTGVDVVEPNDGVISLREAVAVANTVGGGEIEFDTTGITDNTCTLATQLLVNGYKGISINPEKGTDFALLDIGSGGGRPEPLAIGNIVIGVGTGNSGGINLVPTELFSSNGEIFSIAIDNRDPSGTPVGNIDWRDRGDSTNFESLVWMAEDFVKNNAGIIRVTLSGLPAGRYRTTSLHIDPGFDQCEAIAIAVTDARGANVDTGVIASAFQSPIFDTNSLTEAIVASHQVQFEIISDGVSPVIIHFDGSAAVDTEVPLGGLRLERINERITLAGTGADRLLSNSAGTNLSLSNLLLTNGNTSGDGGAILNNGHLTLSGCEISHSTANRGGGIHSSGSNASLGLVNCTVADNSATNTGGGIRSQNSVSLVQTTIAKNKSTINHGGGLFLDAVGETISLVSSTIAANTAGNNGGGIRVNNGNLVIQNSLIAGNSATGPGQDISHIEGSATALGQNLIGSLDSSKFLESADLLTGDAKLHPLGDYGGPTRTMPPRIGSPLLEAIANGAVELTQPGDPVTSNTNSPSGSGPEQAIDNDPNTAYKAFDGDLIAFWDFNDNSNSGSSADLVGGNVGTFVAGAAYTSTGGGRSGASTDRALNLSGTGTDRMSVTDVAFLNAAAAGDELTISFWQKHSSASLVSNSSFWANSPSSDSGRGIQAHVPFSDGSIYFDTAGCCDAGKRISGPTPPGTVWNQWNFITLVKNGSQKQFWINGQLAVAGEGAIPLPVDFTELIIGSQPAGAGDFQGQIDDFAIFSRALTQGEIAQIANTGIPAPEAALTLVHPGGPVVATEVQLTWSADPAVGPAGLLLEGSNDGSNFVPVMSYFLSRPLGVGVKVGRLPVSDPEAFAVHRLTFTGSLYKPSVSIPEVELVYAPATDQRGSARLSDANGDRIEKYDIGAVETTGWLVNTAADENDGPLLGDLSLRDAVDASGSSDIITFDPVIFNGETGDTITLTNGEMDIDGKSLAIDANTISDGVTINGNDASRIFLIGGSGDRYLRNLTLRDGRTDRGGALRTNGGSVTLDHLTITGSHATTLGGGIYVLGGAALILNDSTISGNSVAGNGGGIALFGDLTVDRSTFTGNSATGTGGGIYQSGTLAMTNSTIASNTASSGGAGIRIISAGSGTIKQSTIAPGEVNFSSSGTYTLENSVFAKLTKSGGSGTFAPLGVNLLSTIAGGSGLSAGPNLLVGNLMLAPLGDYGGPTQTRPLMFGSPAIDSGDTALSSDLFVDQRGKIRVRGSAIDLGAFESAALSYVDTTDSDGDGMSDAWEVFFGFNPNAPADGLLDSDGDGLNNGGESLARTNPFDSSSRLRIVDFTRVAGIPTVNDETIHLTWTSYPGLTYSLWQSQNLTDWTPVEGSNIIAVEPRTRIPFVGTIENRFFYRVQVGAASGIAEPVYAAFSNALAPVASWLPDSIVNTGPDTTAMSWSDLSGMDSLFANQAPKFRENATPNGSAAVEFRGGTTNDALATNVGAGQFPLTGATSFTVITAFSPDGNSEVASGTSFNLKSQLVNADLQGYRNDWGLSYASNAIWFGVGNSTLGEATISVPSGRTMSGDWWIAVGTWTADDGSGKPSFAAWLYDRDGNEVASVEPADPNIAAGTTGGFTEARENTGIALGGLRSTLSARNFDGKISAVELYEISADRSLARQLATSMASRFTSDAQAE